MASLQKLIHNKILLYVLFLFSLISIFYLAIHKEFVSVSVFILVAFLTSFFSKNMTVVFLVAILFTFVYRLSKKIHVEGFTDETDETDEKEEDPIEEIIIEENEEKKKKNASTLQESMIADPEELDADAITKKIEKEAKHKIGGASSDNGLDKIQEQTKILLDTHNELLKNLDSMKPYLKQADTFTKSISDMLKKTKTESFSNYK